MEVTLDIQQIRPYLSPNIFLFPQGDGHYLFAPSTRTYARVNKDMETLLNHCDGTMSIAELIVEYALLPEAIDLFRMLFAKGIVYSYEEAHSIDTNAQSPETEQPFTHLTLFPTHRCNLACTYCYAKGGDRTSSMTWRTAQVAFDFLFDQLPDEQSLVALTFHGGGEPTVAFPFIKDAASDFHRRCEAQNRKCHVSMVTNGTFGPNVLGWILENGVSVNFSLDGSSVVQDTQRPFRNGKGSFDVVAKNIRQLHHAGREITVRATVTASSLTHIDELVNTCVELGVAAVQIEPCFAVGRCEETGAAGPNPEEFAQRFLDAYRLGLANDIGVTYSGLRCTDTARDRFCGACGHSVAVTPEGYLTACFEVVHPDDPAAEVFFFGYVDREAECIRLDNDRLKSLRKRNVFNLPQCANCFLKYNCAGDCVVKSFRVGGSIFANVPSRCQMAEIINKKLIGWIADGIIVPRRKDAFEQYLY